MSGLSDQERRNSLVDLVELRLPVGATVATLSKFPWDSEVELVVLTRANSVALLERYLRGELTDIELEQWADAVEGREDIGLEADHAELLSAFIFETANPTLTEPVSERYAHRWVASLNQGGEKQ